MSSKLDRGGENETFVSCDSLAGRDRFLCCTDGFGAIDQDPEDPKAKTAADTDRTNPAGTDN